MDLDSTQGLKEGLFLQYSSMLCFIRYPGRSTHLFFEKKIMENFPALLRCGNVSHCQSKRINPELDILKYFKYFPKLVFSSENCNVSECTWVICHRSIVPSDILQKLNFFAITIHYAIILGLCANQFNMKYTSGRLKLQRLENCIVVT